MTDHLWWTGVCPDAGVPGEDAGAGPGPAGHRLRAAAAPVPHAGQGARGAAATDGGRHLTADSTAADGGRRPESCGGVPGASTSTPDRIDTERRVFKRSNEANWETETAGVDCGSAGVRVGV